MFDQETLHKIDKACLALSLFVCGALTLLLISEVVNGA